MTDTKAFGMKDGLRLLAGIAWLAALAYQPRITLAVTCLLIGAAFMVFNAMVFAQSVFGKGEGPSVAPIFGGLIAAAGVALLPIEGAWHWAWLPLLLDWGGLPMFVFGTTRYLWTTVLRRGRGG